MGWAVWTIILKNCFPSIVIRVWVGLHVVDIFDTIYILGNFHPPIMYIEVRVCIWEHDPL
jgi:hypothetical protein